MADTGWINDPNGFCYYNGEYHLFYQYHPYSSEWGPMHWGHSKSKDLVKWESLPVALAPDMYYDANGCFSGSAIEKDGRLYLMYTGNTDSDPGNPENLRQIQNIAISEDGINFIKSKANPVISTRDLPESAIPQDFRDPKVFKYGKAFYSIIGSRNEDGSGQLLLYKSENLLQWTYAGTLAKSENKLGKMWECPDLFEIDGTSVILMSPQFLERAGDKYCNVHSSVYILGHCELENCSFESKLIEEIDSGFDFYAPQTLVDEKGRRIMIAWMQMWQRNFPTNEKNHGWAGAMTLPRELKIINGKLYQLPMEEVKAYRVNQVHYKDIELIKDLTLKEVEGNSVEIELEIDFLKANRFGMKLLKDSENETVIYYDKEQGKLILGRSKNGEKLVDILAPEVVDDIRKVAVDLLDNKLKLRIFVDRSSVEIFIQDGEKTMTSTVYPKASATAIEFFSDKQVIIKELYKWEIKL
jgi:beta-fructofuranosidase